MSNVTYVICENYITLCKEIKMVYRCKLCLMNSLTTIEF